MIRRCIFPQVTYYSFQIDDVIPLPVYKHSSMFFVLRSMNDAGMLDLHTQPLTLADLDPVTGIQVFDLPLDFEFGVMESALTSPNLGNVTRVLHDADVDFTSVTRGIAAAVTGLQCEQYSWNLQVNSLTR